MCSRGHFHNIRTPLTDDASPAEAAPVGIENPAADTNCDIQQNLGDHNNNSNENDKDESNVVTNGTICDLSSDSVIESTMNESDSNPESRLLVANNNRNAHNRDRPYNLVIQEVQENFFELSVSYRYSRPETTDANTEAEPVAVGDTETVTREADNIHIFIPLTIISVNQTLPNFDILIDGAWSVYRLKEYLFETYPEKPPVDYQKLIFAGRILDDKLRIEDIMLNFHSACGDNESKKIHLMIVSPNLRLAPSAMEVQFIERPAPPAPPQNYEENVRGVDTEEHENVGNDEPNDQIHVNEGTSIFGDLGREYINRRRRANMSRHLFEDFQDIDPAMEILRQAFVRYWSDVRQLRCIALYVQLFRSGEISPPSLQMLPHRSRAMINLYNLQLNLLQSVRDQSAVNPAHAFYLALDVGRTLATIVSQARRDSAALRGGVIRNFYRPFGEWSWSSDIILIMLWAFIALFIVLG